MIDGPRRDYLYRWLTAWRRRLGRRSIAVHPTQSDVALEDAVDAALELYDAWQDAEARLALAQGVLREVERANRSFHQSDLHRIQEAWGHYERALAAYQSPPSQIP